VNGETGFLVPSRNPSALAAAIVRLIEEPKLRQEMGEKGRERFLKYFTVDVMARETEKVYEECLDRQTARWTHGSSRD
jgi:glycosyltransferase involved in cell wall biosynthesis